MAFLPLLKAVGEMREVALSIQSAATPKAAGVFGLLDLAPDSGEDRKMVAPCIIKDLWMFDVHRYLMANCNEVRTRVLSCAADVRRDVAEAEDSHVV